MAADSWSAWDAYEPYVGRWSRLVAAEFLQWLGVARGARWLDVGCGTGALTSTILASASPASVVAVDRSEGYLAYARSRVADPRARFEAADATRIPVADSRLDAVVSGLVLNFVPDQPRMVAEMRRVARPGGVVALYVWDYQERMELIRRFWDAAVALDPAAAELDEGRRFPVTRPEPLARLLAGAGLAQVETRAIEVPTVFRDFDDYWTPFLGGQGPAPGYCMSLGEERRQALRRRLEDGLPSRPDGSIVLVARAWAARGVTR